MNNFLGVKNDNIAHNVRILTPILTKLHREHHNNDTGSEHIFVLLIREHYKTIEKNKQCKTFYNRTGASNKCEWDNSLQEKSTTGVKVRACPN